METSSPNPLDHHAPKPKRPSFLLYLLVLILCLLLGGGIGIALLALMHLFHIPGKVSLAPAILILTIFGLGTSLYNFLSKKFPTKIDLSRTP